MSDSSSNRPSLPSCFLLSPVPAVQLVSHSASPPAAPPLPTPHTEIGELLLHRAIAQFKRAYKRNDKPITIAAAKFLAHLINQGVLHEVGGVLGVCGGHVFWGGGDMACHVDCLACTSPWAPAAVLLECMLTCYLRSSLPSSLRPLTAPSPPQPPPPLVPLHRCCRWRC